MRSLIVVLITAATLAGCTGEDATPDDATLPDLPAGAEIVTETIEGYLQSAHAGVVRVNANGATNGDPVVFEFTVPAGTNVTTLNFTAEALSGTGGEVDILVGEPGCDATLGSACETSYTTENMQALITLEAPQSGTYSIRVFQAEPGVQEFEFQIIVESLVFPVDCDADEEMAPMSAC